MLTEIVDFSKLKQKKQKDRFCKLLDLQAAIVILEECSKSLNICTLPDINPIKTEIKNAIKSLTKKYEAEK